MKTMLFLFLSTILLACRQKAFEKPIWLNPGSFVTMPADSLYFQSEGDDWQAELLSFTQPIPIRLQKQSTGFTICAANAYGLVEGPAELILYNKHQQFIYSFYLRNQSTSLVGRIDYRSPKTVNPDSSLLQQSLVHHIDKWRNIVPIDSVSGLFSERLYAVPAVAAVYRAQPENPLSAYYVEPGSATSISISYQYITGENAFEVATNKLTDANGNTVANGTLVAFLFDENEILFRQEHTTIDGIARIRIPAANKLIRIRASVNETISNNLLLEY